MPTLISVPYQLQKPKKVTYMTQSLSQNQNTEEK